MAPFLRNSVHVLTHVLFGVLAWVVVNFGQPVDPLVLLPVAIGSLLPDVDTSTSFVGRLLSPLSKRLETWFGHRQEVHSLLATGVLAGLAWPLRLIPEVGGSAGLTTGFDLWLALLVGWCSHLVLDLLNPAGIGFLLPVARGRVRLLGGRVRQYETSERVLFVVLALSVAGAVYLNGVGTSELLHAAIRSPDLARERYRQIEGRYQAYADVEGTWQDGSHMRVAGRYEVVGLVGEVFTLRDPDTGETFTAGQAADADVYVNDIHVTQGEAIWVAARATSTPGPTPTPRTLMVRISGVTDPQRQILVRPGGQVVQGQLLADLSPDFALRQAQGTALVGEGTPLPTGTPTVIPTPPATPTWSPNPLTLAEAEAELALARAEATQAAEGVPPSEAGLLQGEAAIAQIQASIASLQYLQATSPELGYVPAQLAAAEARLAAAEARLEELKRWKVPSAGDRAVAAARLALAEVKYQQALASPTPRPTRTATPLPIDATLTPTPTPVVLEYRALVSGWVLDVRIVSIRGNEATVDIVLVVGQDVLAADSAPPSGGELLGTVVEVVDGDTVDVLVGTATERVRLIGVDTPETKHPDRPVECYGPEASAYTAGLLPPGTGVRLVMDVEARDAYGRLLAYVYLVDGRLVNGLLVQEGYARTLSIPPNTAHAVEFAALEVEAQEAGRGLWVECP